FVGAGGDEGADSLGLVEGQAAAEVGAGGELAGIGVAEGRRAGEGKHAGHYALDEGGGAGEEELGGVLARVRGGGGGVEAEDWEGDAVGKAEVRAAEAAGCGRGIEEGGEEAWECRAAEADQGAWGAAEAGGEGGDRVGGEHGDLPDVRPELRSGG